MTEEQVPDQTGGNRTSSLWVVALAGAATVLTAVLGVYRYVCWVQHARVPTALSLLFFTGIVLSGVLWFARGWLSGRKQEAEYRLLATGLLTCAVLFVLSVTLLCFAATRTMHP